MLAHIWFSLCDCSDHTSGCDPYVSLSLLSNSWHVYGSAFTWLNTMTRLLIGLESAKKAWKSLRRKMLRLPRRGTLSRGSTGNQGLRVIFGPPCAINSICLEMYSPFCVGGLSLSLLAATTLTLLSARYLTSISQVPHFYQPDGHILCQKVHF